MDKKLFTLNYDPDKTYHLNPMGHTAIEQFAKQLFLSGPTRVATARRRMPKYIDGLKQIQENLLNVVDDPHPQIIKKRFTSEADPNAVRNFDSYASNLVRLCKYSQHPLKQVGTKIGLQKEITYNLTGCELIAKELGKRKAKDSEEIDLGNAARKYNDSVYNFAQQSIKHNAEKSQITEALAQVCAMFVHSQGETFTREGTLPPKLDRQFIEHVNSTLAGEIHVSHNAKLNYMVGFYLVEHNDKKYQIFKTDVWHAARNIIAKNLKPIQTQSARALHTAN